MRKAFTLVEVLTSMAIIAVLAGLLFSGLSSSIHASKNTVCISNLHQLQVAMTLYHQDFGEYPPSNDQWEGLLPYLGGKGLRCPYVDVANQMDPPRLRTNYFLNGFDSGMTKYDLECRERRGSDYPLAYDTNHASPLVAVSTGKRVYTFVRVDGSVATEDARLADSFNFNPTAFPCPKAGEYSNLK